MVREPAVCKCVFCPGLPDSMSLKAECCDEDVDEDCEEDTDCCYVVHPVQLGVFPHIIQIVLHCWSESHKNKKKIS